VQCRTSQKKPLRNELFEGEEIQVKKEQSISTPSILGFQPFRFEVVNTPKGTLGHSHSIHVNVIEAQGSVSLLGTIFWMSYGLSVASNQPK